MNAGTPNNCIFLAKWYYMGFLFTTRVYTTAGAEQNNERAVKEKLNNKPHQKTISVRCGSGGGTTAAPMYIFSGGYLGAGGGGYESNGVRLHYVPGVGPCAPGHRTVDNCGRRSAKITARKGCAVWV